MKLLLPLALVLLLLFPNPCLTGARNGLLLWFDTVLPTLFPFLFLSSMLIQTGTARKISKLLRPVFTPLFRVSTNCCYAILIGMVSGYPLGAKTCADLTERKEISPEEGQYLLCFCNNASPMFLISFVGGSLLGMPQGKCVLLWLTVIASAILTGALYRISHPFSVKDRYSPNQDPITGKAAANAVPPSPDNPLETALESAIQIITKVGGYIILFGILGHLATLLPFVPPLVNAVLAGFLEITTGGNAIASLPVPLPVKTVLLCAVCAFGGLSGLLQTKSVTGSSGLSVRLYFRMKLLHALLAAALSHVLLSVNIL